MRRLVVLVIASLIWAGGAGGTASADAGCALLNCKSLSDVTTSDETNYTARSAVSYSGSGFAGGRGNVRPVSWQPPACWYEPRWSSPEAFERWALTDFRVELSRMGEHQEWERFEDEYPPYRVGEGGSWYSRTCLDYASSQAQAFNAGRPWAVWVNPAGSNAPAEAVTPSLLADLALAHLTLPEPSVSVNPANQSVVNLGTWVWSDTGAQPLTVTAALGALSTTVTATPTGLRLDPGTTDAVTHPASGTCAGTGRAYDPATDDPAADPPCGVTYLRSTAARPGGYALAADLAWQVTWTSTTGQGGVFPPASTTATTPVQVSEIQTLVTRAG